MSYRSRDEAKLGVAWMRGYVAQTGIEHKDATAVYKCPFCKYWHLTTQERK